MPVVTSYSIRIYGGPDGYATNRAQIGLSDANGQTVALLQFNDPGMVFEADAQEGGIIMMRLPSALFQSTLDVLRNEKPISVSFAKGHALLDTQGEPVGEGES